MGALISKLWAADLIGLSLWEILSFRFRRVPSVSQTAALAHKRWPTPTRIALLGWTGGLVAYLLTKQP